MAKQCNNPKVNQATGCSYGLRRISSDNAPEHVIRLVFDNKSTAQEVATYLYKKKFISSESYSALPHEDHVPGPRAEIIIRDSFKGKDKSGKDKFYHNVHDRFIELLVGQDQKPKLWAGDTLKKLMEDKRERIRGKDVAAAVLELKKEKQEQKPIGYITAKEVKEIQQSLVSDFELTNPGPEDIPSTQVQTLVNVESSAAKEQMKLNF